MNNINLRSLTHWHVMQIGLLLLLRMLSMRQIYKPNMLLSLHMLNV